MPVPSSFNDITQDSKIRDFVGWFQYKRDFIIHSNFYNPKINDLYIHFGSVHYHCEVFLNDLYVGNHSSGHLPFEFKINSTFKINLNGKNTIRLMINNILTETTTIPQGRTWEPQNSTRYVYPAGFKQTSSSFDFFNYAGNFRN